MKRETKLIKKKDNVFVNSRKEKISEIFINYSKIVF